MMVKNKTNKNYKRSQKGRSMVEMLGVLAIVGVLSVGGVYGYGVAMKKHKANELLHRASMLASTVSAQIMSGKDPTELDTFADSNLGKFTLDYDSTKTTFDLKISELDGSVCSQLKKGGMVQNVDCNPDAKTATLSYYKNLATNDEEGKKSPTGGKEKVDPCDSAKCAENQQCIGGACAEVSACTEDCQNCYWDEDGNEICDDTIGCSKNSDCDDWCKAGEKCFCAISADETGKDSACYNNFTGQCAVATSPSDDADEYTVSADYMSWWSAVNFCKAHGKSLVSLANLGITGGYQDDADCEGSDCTGSFTWGDLQDKLAEEFYWVTDAANCKSSPLECTAGSNNNSCNAFHVDLIYTPDSIFGVVYIADRSEVGMVALCE